MNNKRVDATFLQKHLGEMLGMDKTASKETSAERLASLSHKATENMELLKTAMAAKVPQKPAAAPKPPVPPKPSAAAAKEKKEHDDKKKKEAERKFHFKKSALDDLKLATDALEVATNDAALMKNARSELLIGIMTDQLVAPYDQIAKAAGIVTLNNLCRSNNQ